MGSLKKQKMMKNQMKNDENFKDFSNVSILWHSWGVSRQLEAACRRLWAAQRRLGGVLGGLRAVLEASWRVLEASWRCLGGVLGRLGGILDVSWEKCRKKVECTQLFGGVLRAKMKAKIIKICIKNATCFS